LNHEIREILERGRAEEMKRLFDIVFAAVGLVVLSPLLLLVAVAVKVSSRGPVLFRQERIGQGGRAFYIVKFRSMVANAENAGPSITPEGDPRVTRIGRFLRKTKLDELPQLWNVLVGEMSFVGPRPEVPKYVSQYTPEQRRVLELKPGITDLATLEFRKEEEMLRRRTEDGGRCVGESEDGRRRTAREKAEGRMQNAEVGNIEDGGRRTEDGRQKTDHGPLTTGPRTTDYGPRTTDYGGRCVGGTEDGGRRTAREKAEGRIQNAEVGNIEDGGRRTELLAPLSTINSQPSTISSALEKYYLEYCVPRKIELNLEYAKRANVWQDVLIILRTLVPFCEAKQWTKDGTPEAGEPEAGTPVGRRTEAGEPVGRRTEVGGTEAGAECKT
jgi:lipopolysaccharide/colanic/teichoic acid biosynthesis glycosyltransferase